MELVDGVDFLAWARPGGALASPDYHIEGPKLKIARAIPVLNAMSAVSARLPKRYA